MKRKDVFDAHDFDDSTPSPTIRQPKRKVTVLQLAPRPEAPHGNNEETLPAYTPELGRSVRRLEHNYRWDSQWLGELYKVVMANAEALSLVQVAVDELDQETGVIRERTELQGKQTAASLGALGAEVLENDRLLKGVLEYDHRRVKAEMDERAAALAKLLEAANVEYVGTTKRLARLEEQLADHRILLSASQPRVLAPGIPPGIDSAGPPPPPAMTAEIDARFEGIAARADEAGVKALAAIRRIDEVYVKIAEVEDFAMQLMASGTASCPCTTGKCPCRCGQPASSAAGDAGARTPGACPLQPLGRSEGKVPEDPLQKDDAWKQYHAAQGPAAQGPEASRGAGGGSGEGP